MQPSELMELVQELSSKAYVRYWLEYEPGVMAIAILQAENIATIHDELESKGFAWECNHRLGNIYAIARSDSPGATTRAQRLNDVIVGLAEKYAFDTEA